VSVISLLICVWFILPQGTKPGPAPYVAIWCGVALSLDTLFGVWRFSVYNRLAQPGAAPDNGRMTPTGKSDFREGPPSASGTVLIWLLWGRAFGSTIEPQAQRCTKSGSASDQPVIG